MTRAHIALQLALALCLLVPLMILGPARSVQAQEPQTEADAAAPGEEPAAASYADQQLVRALTEAGLVDEWTDASGVSAEAALVEVLGDETYETARAVLLDDVDRLIERRTHIDDRIERGETLAHGVDVLETLTRGLRRETAGAGRHAALSLTPPFVAEARLTLDSITGSRRWFGMSLDPLALAEHRLIRARDELAREIDNLSLGLLQGDKTLDTTVAAFTQINADLRRIRFLAETTDKRSLAAEFEYAAHRSEVIATMAGFHDLRLLRSTSVGGLSVVTLDAYVRGAEALDPSCPVDWALLAGIGRVESRHGTVDDATVQRSGRVSKSILGPLLDGGATEREAVAAAAAAIEAEEALRLAEAEAAAEEPEPAFDAAVWGEDTIERASEQVESATASHTPVGRAAPPEPLVEETPKPRYDPLLWGDDLPFDEDDLPPLDEDSDDGDDSNEEEPEFRGNGFAVIADSDNGRLDGNARWDRAVGPMQFIPETWSYWEIDGNNDGAIDPQNLYDAAATAGQFLCHLSRTRGPSPSSFVLGYNSSQTYVRNVTAVADAFRANQLPLVED